MRLWGRFRLGQAELFPRQFQEGWFDFKSNKCPDIACLGSKSGMANSKERVEHYEVRAMAMQPNAHGWQFNRECRGVRALGIPVLDGLGGNIPVFPRARLCPA